jgi:hypothetical protein
MQLYKLDPLTDSRWDDLVASHPSASVFHRAGWLKALAATYKYRTVVITSAPPAQRLSDGLVFCEVRSWATGSRLVSLPFSDHAEPLLEKDGANLEIAEWMRAQCDQENLKYVEFRPLSDAIHAGQPLVQSQSFWLHTLDLAPPTEQLFRNLHKSCLQGRIRHAERQQLFYERGDSVALLDEFYKLLMLTRRRFGLLPQPRAWFRNVLSSMRPNAEIRVARKDGKAIAAILTLRHRQTIVYKYGCSDGAYNQLAGMPFLFWRLIEESKAQGIEQIDFGRTDLHNEGLIRFKDRFGTQRRKLNYFRYAEKAMEKPALAADTPATRALCSVLPAALSSRAGELVYRHIG